MARKFFEPFTPHVVKGKNIKTAWKVMHKTDVYWITKGSSNMNWKELNLANGSNALGKLMNINVPGTIINARILLIGRLSNVIRTLAKWLNGLCKFINTPIVSYVTVVNLNHFFIATQCMEVLVRIFSAAIQEGPSPNKSIV